MATALRLGMILMLGAIFLLVGGLDAGEKKPEDTVVNDQLTTGEAKDKVRTQSYCKTYVYKMTEGKTYQLDMVSAAFDSYLRLEDEKGQQVAADDDGGGFPSARIIFRAPKTGDYTIICTTFGGGSTGKYTLTVKQTN